VTGEETVIHYLKNLSQQEASVLFDHARYHGDTQFEFYDVLRHKKHDATMHRDSDGYTVELAD
jgi:hypothetical protein